MTIRRAPRRGSSGFSPPPTSDSRTIDKEPLIAPGQPSLRSVLWSMRGSMN